MRAKRGEPGAVETTNKWRATMQAKYGENWRERMRELGRKGGQKQGTQGGFACLERGADGLTGPERARIAGAKAGQISKRGFKFIREENGHRVYLAKNTGKVVKYEI